MTVRTSDFDFDLPDELIASVRQSSEGSRDCWCSRGRRVPSQHSSFARVADHLRPGDLLVVNDTRVFPARLVGHRVPSGGAVECLLLRKLPDAPDLPNPGSRVPIPEVWEALMHPGQRLKTRCPRAVRTRRSAGARRSSGATFPGAQDDPAVGRERRHRARRRNRADRAHSASALHRAPG